jgi:hypothetical protein
LGVMVAVVAPVIGKYASLGGAYFMIKMGTVCGL